MANIQELLKRARANLAAKKESEAALAVDEMQKQATARGATDIDFTKAGIDSETLKTEEGQEAAIDIIKDVARNISGIDTTEQFGVVEQDEMERGERPEPVATTKTYGVAKDVILNDRQQEFNTRVQSGEDCVLIGAAGTGKTTSMRRVTQDLIGSSRLTKLREGTKWLHAGLPGAVILSYTRKAVNNIKHAVVAELKPHTLTIHKLLEFQPEFYEIEDPNKPGEFKTTMQFVPTRHNGNPLPADLSLIAFEESSMISVELYQLLQDAMPHAHQEIFLGDINQLPPIFGLAILGFKMNELPVVELTEVYRQALESPIIDLAWTLLGGNPYDFDSKTERYEIIDSGGKKAPRIRCPALDKYTRSSEAGEVKFQIWQKQLSADTGLITLTKQFCVWSDQGYYNPQDDIILCPFNKSFGTTEINKGIAQYLGRKRNATVYEVIAGFNKHYLAVGDRVLYDKEDAFITSIARNGEYLGKQPQHFSIHLDRWGHLQEPLTEQEKFELTAEEGGGMDIEAIEAFMATAADDVSERVQAASHVIGIKLAYGDEEIVLNGAADVNALLGGYCITVHKAQGSEWERVFFIMHNSHKVMNQRELLYTAVTRAKKFLHIIAETDTFEKGIKSQKIKGDTLAEKAEHFKGKEEDVKKLGKEAVIGKKSGGKFTIIAGSKAVKLEDIVPAAVLLRANDNLTHYWNDVAIPLFGAGIGKQPELSFNLRRKDAVGLAYPGLGKIKLNPIWCAVDDPSVVEDVITNTLRHEIAHIIDYRLNKKMGHGVTWAIIMRKFGLPAERIHPEPLPPYLASKKDLLVDVFARLAKEDAEDDLNVEDGEV